MEEIKKIVLSPTRPVKERISEAVGASVYCAETRRMTINLFNMPEPSAFLRDEEMPTTYHGWFYNPNSGEIVQIGALTPAGESLYWLFDAPVELREDFTEIIITAERENSLQPHGEILLIGYMTDGTPGLLEPFQPFARALPNHRWWKLNSVSPCQFCMNGTANMERLRTQGFDLPEIIGVHSDENDQAQYMVHGIPGRFLRTEQPAGGRTGYLHWQPYYGMEQKTGAIGYWLSYIDLKTNQTVSPLGVTIPPG